VPGDGPKTDNVKSTNSDTDSKSDSAVNVSSASGGTQGPAIRVVVPGKPDLQIWLQGVPSPLFNAIDKLTKPPSAWNSIFKDIVPGLTSLAAVLISLAALIFTYIQWSQAKTQRDKAADTAQKKVLADLIQNFDRIGVSRDTGAEDQQKLEIASMRLAAYGDQALPAVRMAFGANNDGLRDGGMLVAKQMYRGMTVEHGRLIGEILGYYKTSSPVLQYSVLEWLVKMKRELSDEEGALAVGMLRQTFGKKGENCPNQNTKVAMEVTNFLPIWPTNDSRELLRGMAVKCGDPEIRDHASDELNSLK
jgi:hypothetical protein